MTFDDSCLISVVEVRDTAVHHDIRATDCVAAVAAELDVDANDLPWSMTNVLL